MDPIHIHQRLRPERYAFLVDQGDTATALRAVSLNTALWGGVYNPIMLNAPNEQSLGMLREFDPDKLVNMSGRSVAPEFGRGYDERIVSADEIVGSDERTGVRTLKLGFNILPLLQWLREREGRLPWAPLRPALITTTDGDGWAEYVSFSFGSFSSLPDIDVDFRTAFLTVLDAETRVFDPGVGGEIVHGAVSPLHVTRHDLQRFGGYANVSSHIIYVGDHRSLSDLLEFWNIRATGRTVWFVPLATYRAHEWVIKRIAEQGHYKLNPRVENTTDLQKGISVSQGAFTEVGDWIATLGVPPMSRRAWSPRFGVVIDGYVGDIHAADLEAQASEEVSLLQEKRMTPVKLVTPRYFDQDRRARGAYSWSVELSMRGAYGMNQWLFSFPRVQAVEAVVRRAIAGLPGEVRVGKNGLVVAQDSHSAGSLYMQPVPTREVFYSMLGQAGMEASPSQPGRYAEQIIEKMGSLQFGCRVFKLRGVRDILHQLSNGGTLTKGNMHQIVTSETPDAHGQNWRADLYDGLVVRAGQRRRSPGFEDVFGVLLEHRVIRPGFSMRCRQCFAESWYHVSEFDEEYTCRFCFTRQRVDFASKHEWQYKADGLLQIPDSAQGSLAVILALWRLNEFHGLGEGRYLTSVSLEVPGGKQYESDYSFLRVGSFDASHEFVLGEARAFVDYTEKDVVKMGELADRFDAKPFLAFATLKETFSDAEKQLLKDLVDRDYRVIALTRLELDPYDLFDRFEAAPYKHAVTLDELAQNTWQLNL